MAQQVARASGAAAAARAVARRRRAEATAFLAGFVRTPSLTGEEGPRPHRPDEFVPLAEYHAAIEGLIELLVRWCGILE